MRINWYDFGGRIERRLAGCLTAADASQLDEFKGGPLSRSGPSPLTAISVAAVQTMRHQEGVGGTSGPDRGPHCARAGGSSLFSPSSDTSPTAVDGADERISRGEAPSTRGE